MSKYHDSDSSDDDVCFGKYTMDEARRDWHKYRPKKINRRHSTICKLTESQKDTTQDTSNLANPFEENTNTSVQKNWSSEYLTANESMSASRLSQNSEFLEKLTKVINDPVSEASSYNTAFDQTNVRENIGDQYDDTFLSRFKNQTTFALDNVHHTLVENTILPLEDSLHETSNYDNKNSKSYNQKIINDSIISVSDESSILLNSESDDLDASRSPVLSEELFSKAINDEEFSSHRNITNKDQLIDHSNFQNEYSTDQLENQNYHSMHLSKSSFDFKNLSISDTDTEIEHLQRFDRIVDYKQLSKISERTEFTTCIEDGSSMSQQDDSSGVSSTGSLSGPEKLQDSDSRKKDTEEITRNATPDVYSTNSYTGFSLSSNVSKPSSLSGVSQLSSNSEVSSTSSMHVPSIHVEQSDESYQFDDTLEEINRFLEQGLDYEMPEITHSKTTPLKEPFSSDHIISGSFMNTSLNSAGLENKTPKTKMLSTKSAEKCKMFYSAEKITKREGVVTAAKTRSQQELSKFSTQCPRSLFTKKTEMEGAFKVPTNPVKKLATPSKLPKPLKTIVSPVGVYIKHSPKYYPMINVPQNTSTHHTKLSKLVKPVSTLVKENIPCASNIEFPKVIYRPAQHREVHEENEVVLPKSIKNLIKEQVVTKHELRIQDDDCNQSIERRLMESDLSINLSHNNQDISILTNKQPFNIKRF